MDEMVGKKQLNEYLQELYELIIAVGKYIYIMLFRPNLIRRLNMFFIFIASLSGGKCRRTMFPVIFL